jgi:hypothetical protein
MLRKGRQGKRDESDCGPEHHGSILRPIENSVFSEQWSVVSRQSPGLKAGSLPAWNSEA